MNNDQLEKGNKITEVIQSLKVQLFVWTNARSVENILVCSKHPERVDSYYNYNVNAGHIDFEILKTLTTNAIQKKLDEAEKEFASI